MKNKPLLITILLTGMSLGTAWAVRGQFGHEQGAAWAGAIGAMAFVLASRRVDWYQKFFRIALAAAFGWGLGGVISYGIVVGYGRGVDFVNVYYGLVMLFVIGGLYGFIGGGFFGLALLDSSGIRVKWHALLVEMVALGLLTYGFLINQLEWLMTPPRSEMWAACLGAAIAVGWFVIRNGHAAVLRVSIWASLGAGFGFAFGNFLQVMGNVLEIEFNMWNVMEYSIGFFGGTGMAYGTCTAQWPVATVPPVPRRELLPALLLLVFIPFVVWDQSFVTERIQSSLGEGGSASGVFYVKLAAILAISAVAAGLLVRIFSPRQDNSLQHEGVIKSVYILYFLLYIFLSFLVTGILRAPLNQYLYLVNLAAVLMLLPHARAAQGTALTPRKWMPWLLTILIFLALLAAFAIHTHEAYRNTQVRFNF